MQDMVDYEASDKVTYPGIVHIPKNFQEEIILKFKIIYGEAFKPLMVFGRYSLSSMSPPHWAHSDRNMCQYVGLIYLSRPMPDNSGTYLVRHRFFNFEKHPRTEGEKEILLRESNDKGQWDRVFYCKPVFNRLFVVNADYLHAAGESFGTSQMDGRFVVSVFFNLES